MHKMDSAAIIDFPAGVCSTNYLFQNKYLCILQRNTKYANMSFNCIAGHGELGFEYLQVRFISIHEMTLFKCKLIYVCRIIQSDRDAYLLYALDQNNERERRGVALTLSHELAHQWAGNLITCDWWTMAWLNEGCETEQDLLTIKLLKSKHAKIFPVLRFATYLSYQGMEYTNPEYEGQKALQYDCIMNGN